MDLILFFKATLLGVAIAAPVGPIGLLCIQRTLQFGLVSGLASGLGAATADALFATLGALSFSAVTGYLTELASPMALVGGIFLLYLGQQLLRQKPAAQAKQTAGKKTWLKAFSSTLALTLANPLTVLSFTALFSALHTDQSSDAPAAMSLVLGIFLGSTLWWLGLCVLVSRLEQKISATSQRWINRAAGVFLLLFGLWQLAKLIQ